MDATLRTNQDFKILLSLYLIPTERVYGAWTTFLPPPRYKIMISFPVLVTVLLERVDR